MKPFAAIGGVTTAAILVFAVTAKVLTYHTAPIFLIPLTWLPVLLRGKLNLHAVHYAMFCLGMLLHSSGARGYYQHSPFPISFDIVVHFYFAFAVVFILQCAIASNFPVKFWQASVTAGMFMMGIGALHEIMEYGSYLLLGEEKGMLKPHTSYFFDTQRDLTNNLLGTLLALTVIAIVSVVQRSRARTSSSDTRLPVPERLESA